MSRKKPLHSSILTPIRESIYEELRKRDLTVWKMSKLLGRNPKTVYTFLHGGNNSISLMAQIADFLHRPDLLLEYVKIVKNLRVENKLETSSEQSQSRKEEEV